MLGPKSASVPIKRQNMMYFPNFMWKKIPIYILILRWYGTPRNIFKDDRILKNDYNHGFKNFICPQNAFMKFHTRDKR